MCVGFQMSGRNGVLSAQRIISEKSIQSGQNVHQHELNYRSFDIVHNIGNNSIENKFQCAEIENCMNY